MAVQDGFGTGGLASGAPGQASDGFTGSGLVGRFINNLTGKTATNDFNAREAEKARLFNSAEAQKQRDWETMMSNTAYQRSASDMKAAGINPASLGGNGAGSAASTPSGATANGVAAHSGEGSNFLSSILGVVVSGIGSALRNQIARSALSIKSDGLDLKKFEARSKDIFRAASIADKEANTALKRAKDSRDFDTWRRKLEGIAQHTDLEEQKTYNTYLKNILLNRAVKRKG